MDSKIAIVILSIVSVFTPVQPLIATALVLIVVDTILGIICAYKANETITSAKLSRAFAKGFIYTTGIAVGFLVEHYMLAGFIPVSKLAASAIGFSEALSIFESLNKLHGGNIFTAIIDKFSSQNLPKK